MKEEIVKTFLSDVKQDNIFRVHLGTNIGNLYELRDALSIMSDDSFHHHVTSSKNDFSAWIKNVVKDKDLAKDTDKIKDRQKMRDIIAQRINELEAMAVGDTFSTDARSTVLDFLMGMVVGFVIGYLVAMMI